MYRDPTRFHEATEESRDGPPENSSSTRKGSKYFSSNLQKKKPKHPLIQTFKFIQKFIPLSEKNTI